MPAQNNATSYWEIASRQIGIPVKTAAPGIVLATSSTQNLFISHGPVLLTGLIGVVTTVFDAAASLIRFWIGVSGTTWISGVSGSLTATAAGTVVYITGVFATAAQIALLVPISLASQSVGGLFVDPIIWPDGQNLGETTTTGQTTGVMQFYCWYQPLQEGAYVTPVA